MLEKIFCKHEYLRVRGIHGDEITHSNKRSIWKCVKCGKTELSDYLYSLGKVRSSIKNLSN